MNVFLHVVTINDLLAFGACVLVCSITSQYISNTCSLREYLFVIAYKLDCITSAVDIHLRMVVLYCVRFAHEMEDSLC